jgi:hypothetical protein
MGPRACPRGEPGIRACVNSLGRKRGGSAVNEDERANRWRISEGRAPKAERCIASSRTRLNQAGDPRIDAAGKPVRCDFVEQVANKWCGDARRQKPNSKIDENGHRWSVQNCPLGHAYPFKGIRVSDLLTPGPTPLVPVTRAAAPTFLARATGQPTLRVVGQAYTLRFGRDFASRTDGQKLNDSRGGSILAFMRNRASSVHKNVGKPEGPMRPALFWQLLCMGIVRRRRRT